MVNISARAVQELEKRHPTAFFVFDDAVLEQNVKELRSLFPHFKHAYSVKANAHEHILQFFLKKKLCFDTASREEIQKLHALSAPAHALFFNHPIKTTENIKDASRLGVQWFTVDNMEEVEKVIRFARNPFFLIRLFSTGQSALYHHTSKFGADKNLSEELIKTLCTRFKIPPHRIGLSFQAGTQVTDVQDWIHGLELCNWLIKKTRCVPGLIDMGGGLPVHYEKSMKPLRKKAATVITRFVENNFPKTVQCMIEPGRFLVAEAGMLVVSTTAIVNRRSDTWIFIDAGAYSGLLEAPLSHVVYPVQSKSKKRKHTYNIAGPARDGADIIRKRITLPKIHVGDHLYIQNCGAYSLSFLTNYQLKPYPPVYFINTTSDA